MTDAPNAARRPEGVPSYVDPEMLGSYLARTRWFGGKGRPFTVTGFETLAELPGDGPPVLVHAVEVTYDDAGGAVERYQVPLSYYTHPEPRLDHAFVGWWEHPDHGWVHAYDAMHDRDATSRWLAAFADEVSAGRLRFHRLPGVEIDLAATSTLFAGEQSNSSVTFDDDAVMKLFRKLTPGVNPDIEIHEVLTRAGVGHVAALYGWVDLVDPDGSGDPAGAEPCQLAMLQQFVRTATDGWDLALTSVRTLYAEGTVPVAESGGDFGPEAARLGEALRDVHDAMYGSFPETPPLAAADLGAAMSARLDEALRAAPALAPYEQNLRAVFDLSSLGELATQRIHGDLHLGQTMRAAAGWKIVDFEGEPAKPLEDRRRPDSRWRDVAGMLRSFEYAPRVVARTLGEGDGNDEDEADRRTMLAEAWASRNAAAFLEAYAGGEISPEDERLLAAYVADKAVYETVYETRNRPTWVEIPLAAVARIGAP